MAVQEDLVLNHALVDINGGSSIVRVFRVTDLVDPPHLQLVEALRNPAIPDIGDPYPDLTPTLLAERHNVTPDGPNAARIDVTYRAPNAGRGGTWNQPYPGPGNDGADVKQISSALRQIRTTRDINDNAMLLTKPPTKNGAQDYLSEAIAFRPIWTLVHERIETEPPAPRARVYFGRLNSIALNGGQYAALTLLFSGFDANSQDGGRTWRTTYEFQHDPEGWVHTDAWKDESGRAASDSPEQSWQILPSANLANLLLDFSDLQTPL